MDGTKYTVDDGQYITIRCLFLVACVVDIIFHVLIAGIVSRGFQCEVNIDSLRAVKWPWLEPVLVFLNLGTHGFYAFPMTLRTSGHYGDHMPVSQNLKCYPGMLHVYIVDVLILLVNYIWLRFVVAYVVALYKKDMLTIRMFLHLTIVKLCLQILYVGYEPILQYTFPAETFWLMKLADVCTATDFLFIINSYINALKCEKECKSEELPPSYIEYLIATKKPQELEKEKKETLEAIAVVSEKKNQLK